MFRVVKILLPVLLLLVMMVTVNAKETVIYENDFSSTSLADFSVNGSWKVSGGALTLGSGNGSAYITYSIPDEYVGKDLRIEVDFLGHTSTGGITIGAHGDNLADAASEFFGYEGFTSGTGVKGAFGCYGADGVWKGLVAVGEENIDVADLHMVAEISGDTVVYKILSLDGSTKYFGIEYTIGLSQYDVYNAFNGNFGLRRFYNVNGTFDNFKITVIEDDEMPSMSKILTLGGVAYKASKDLFVVNNTLRGSGAMLTYNDLSENFKAEATLVPTGVSKFFFGMDNLGNGFAFEIHKEKGTVALYRLDKYSYIFMGAKNVPITDEEHYVSVEVSGGYAKLTFDAYSEGADAFLSFEVSLDGYNGRAFGFWLEGGKIKDLNISETVPYEGDTYTNYVVRGADPDVLYYDGTYYLYNRVHNGDNIFVVYTSPDLANWTERNVVFTNDATYTTSSYMSPNVFCYDGIFYLFYAADNADGSSRVYYATSDSPLGPFTHKNGQLPIHDVAEIGGHPYLDESGKVYMTFVRFGSGNHIWIEEVTMKDGVVTPVLNTLTKVISPEFEYEINGYGAVAEGGVIYKHNGYYYMIYASGHYRGDYGESYAIAKNILGPYTKYKYNDILVSNSETYGVGDGVLIPSPDGSELYMVYHRHKTKGDYSSRYTCIDKVKFVKDPNGGADILTVNGPTVGPQMLPSNIYRYDVDRDGTTTLLDALRTFKHIVSGEYAGRYDANANGVNDVADILLILKDALD